jgi:hypothetical protein
MRKRYEPITAPTSGPSEANPGPRRLPTSVETQTLEVRNRSVVDASHLLMNCWDVYAVRPRRKDEQAVGNISSTNVAGPGTTVLGDDSSADPLQAIWPQCARHTLPAVAVVLLLDR